MLKPIIFIHRWLGIFIGFLMTIWCLSGFVMIYSDYPRLNPDEQLRGLMPLQADFPVNIKNTALKDDAVFYSAKVEMMAQTPVLRFLPKINPDVPFEELLKIPTAIDVTNGKSINDIPSSEIKNIAENFGKQFGIIGNPTNIVKTNVDQWNVQGYRRYAPVYRADFSDLQNTQIYISGKTGEVFQQSTKNERFWAWLGAIPHWLYPTILRQNGIIWSLVVILTSGIGCFLTITGIVTGIAKLKRKKDGKIVSPFRGIWWWHHIYGIFFGLLTLTWVASGLFSMNPFGFLGSMSDFDVRNKLGGGIEFAKISEDLPNLKNLPADTVRLEITPLGGKLYYTAINAAGNKLRFDNMGNQSPLSKDEILSALNQGFKVKSFEKLEKPDEYYYSYRHKMPFPVWRAILSDNNRIYIDIDNGQVIRAFDNNGKAYRWLMNGLHSFDIGFMRISPWRDIIILPLLAMVTIICATGTYMGINKIRRDNRIKRLKGALK